MTYYFVIPGAIALASALVFLATLKRFPALAWLALVLFGVAGFISVFFMTEPLTKLWLM